MQIYAQEKYFIICFQLLPQLPLPRGPLSRFWPISIMDQRWPKSHCWSAGWSKISGYNQNPMKNLLKNQQPIPPNDVLMSPAIFDNQNRNIVLTNYGCQKWLVPKGTLDKITIKLNIIILMDIDGGDKKMLLHFLRQQINILASEKIKINKLIGLQTSAIISLEKKILSKIVKQILTNFFTLFFVGS